MIFAIIILGVIILEISLIQLVKSLRKDFQWLITENDELPQFPEPALSKFLNSSFDSEVGWIRKPNTSGIEKGKNGDITFYIDADGARKSSLPHLEKSIAVFGDSYAFCRQVMDSETWEEGVSRALNTGVMNYGVGNYGVDQALIRYRLKVLPDTIKIAVLCFVPETICRIQSYWKHYLEFGNTFAFKPRFKLSDTGELILVRSAIQSPADFKDLKNKLPEIQKEDGFYFTKFRKYQFRKSYIISFFRAPKRQFSIIKALLVKRVRSYFKLESTSHADRAFALVMKDNIREAQKMYSNAQARILLKKILLDFTAVAESRGHKPLVLIIPQLLDFNNDKMTDMPYSEFYKGLADEKDVIDMASKFRAQELSEIYINDQYGGHLSAKGNELVAESITEWIEKLNLSKFQR